MRILGKTETSTRFLLRVVSNTYQIFGWWNAEAVPKLLTIVFFSLTTFF